MVIRDPRNLQGLYPPITDARKINQTAFSSGDAVKLTGISFRDLDYWARRKFLVPSIKKAKGTGTNRQYSLHDLIALCVAIRLRKIGMETKSIRRVVRFLQSKEGAIPPDNPCPLIYLLIDQHGIKFAAYQFIRDVEYNIRNRHDEWVMTILDISKVVDRINKAITIFVRRKSKAS
jgi:DNA-binding transcriptional MerR regulator